MNHVLFSALLMALTSATPEHQVAADEAAWTAAEKVADEIRNSKPEPFTPTTQPEAQWFPQGSLGLFMHWGIHSVKGVQPSWAMIKDYPYGGELHPPERYYALAKEFNPQSYDPDLWMAAAAKAGFTYAVLTAKHHDGYALWPTAYGDMSTRQFMDSRDLLKPYVEACRKHGLKAGFYFSPQDWHYPGYPVGDTGFDYNKRGQPRPISDPEKNRADFERFFTYTIGQLNELLTRYGKIDVLWFDGMGWDGISDLHTEQTMAWIRRLQPGIVINDRWGAGDFKTPEWDMPEGPPNGWWENCISWNGHWGYNPNGKFQSAAWALERLVRARSWGGNFLLNVGPAPDGTMPPGFYERCDELAAWMQHGRNALIGAGSSPGDGRSDVPITTRGDTWFLHVMPNHRGPVTLRYVNKPEIVSLLRTGKPLEFTYEQGIVRTEIPQSEHTSFNEVIAVQWKENPWEKTIRAFEEKDRQRPPPQNSILFVGSSTIGMWDLNKYFPELQTINRGFGGSHFSDVARYADRVIRPYHPKTIVLYAGDNDIASGKSPKRVFADFEAVVASIHHAFRDIRLIVLSIKPSVARWDKYDKMQQVNRLISDLADKDPQLEYVEMGPTLLDPNGNPRPELFLKDGLHMNPEGYQIWSDILKPLLNAAPH